MYLLDALKERGCESGPRSPPNFCSKKRDGHSRHQRRERRGGCEHAVTLRMNDRLIFLRLFKVDTLRRLHHLSFWHFKICCKKLHLKSRCIFKASYTRDKTGPLSPFKEHACCGTRITHLTESGPPALLIESAVLEAAGKRAGRGLANTCSPLSAPHATGELNKPQGDHRLQGVNRNGHFPDLRIWGSSSPSHIPMHNPKREPPAS